MNVKLYEYNFVTKKTTEITQAPSYISADQQKELTEAMKKLPGKNQFVYYWKKNERSSGVFVTGKKVPDQFIASVIEEREHTAMRRSMGSDLSLLLLELELLSSLAGLLRSSDQEEDCSTCTITICPKHPQHKQ